MPVKGKNNELRYTIQYDSTPTDCVQRSRGFDISKNSSSTCVDIFKSML